MTKTSAIYVLNKRVGPDFPAFAVYVTQFIPRRLELAVSAARGIGNAADKPAWIEDVNRPAHIEEPDGSARVMAFTGKRAE
jgi:hypothetical protein